MRKVGRWCFSRLRSDSRPSPVSRSDLQSLTWGLTSGTLPQPACLLQVLVGLVFGALALALSAGTGRTKIAIFGAIGAALAFHLLNSFAALSDTMARWAKFSPFHYYLGSDPLINGVDWGNAAILAGLTLGLIGLSVYTIPEKRHPANRLDMCI